MGPNDCCGVLDVGDNCGYIPTGEIPAAETAAAMRSDTAIFLSSTIDSCSSMTARLQLLRMPGSSKRKVVSAPSISETRSNSLISDLRTTSRSVRARPFQDRFRV